MLAEQYQSATCVARGDASEDENWAGVLSRCPMCGYSLHGLPDEYACPECGFAYDEDTRAWCAAGFRRFAGTSLLALAVVIAGVSVAATLSILTPTRTMALAVMVTLWAALIVSNARAYFARPFVAVTKKGLLLRRLGKEPRDYPWNEVGGVESSRIGSRSRVFVRLRDQRRRIEVTSFLGARNRAHDAFRTAVDQNLCPHGPWPYSIEALQSGVGSS